MIDIPHNPLTQKIIQVGKKYMVVDKSATDDDIKIMIQNTPEIRSTSADNVRPASQPSPEALTESRARMETAQAELERLKKPENIVTESFDGLKILGMDLPRPVDAAIVSIGSGLDDIKRGAKGLFLGQDISGDIERSKSDMAAVKDQYPITEAIGTAVGQSLPLAVAPIGSLGSITSRVLSAFGIGATEGALINESQGQDVIKGAGVGGSVAATAEAFMPIIGRAIGKIFHRIKGKAPDGQLFTPDGNPTRELADALDDAGMAVNDLSDMAIDEIRKNPNIEKASLLRKADFESEKVPATLGDLTQDSTIKQAESRTINTLESQEGSDLARLRVEQSKVIRDRLNQMAEQAGDPDAIADSLKGAIGSVEKKLKKQKTELYKEMFDLAPEIKEVPLAKPDIVKAIPDEKVIDDLSIYAGGAVDQIDDLLVKYGIIKDKDLVKRFLKKKTRGRSNKIIDLNVGNADNLQKSLKAIVREDKSGAANVYAGGIIDAISNEADNAFETLKSMGITDGSEIESLNRARKIVRRLKTEFSRDSVVGKLIAKKRDGYTDVVKNQDVFKQLLKPSTRSSTIDDIEAVLKVLDEAGDVGKKSIDDMQSRVILDLANAAFSQTSTRLNGERLISSSAYNKLLKGYGNKELKALFRNNPEKLERLYKFGRIAENIKPSNIETTKGSGSVILSALNSMGANAALAKMTGGAAPAILHAAEKGLSTTEAKRTYIKAVKPKLEKIKADKYFADELPHLAALLGITQILDKDNE